MTGNLILAMSILLCSMYAKAQKTDRMDDVVIITQFDVKKDHTKKIRKLLHKYVKHAVDNKDNIMAEAYYEEESPSVMWLIERWSSQRGLEQMRNGAAFKLVSLFSEKKMVQPVKT